MQFERVARKSVPEEIIENVKQKILGGELRPGEKLPSESDMAEQFGVGRGTIREAMKIMLYLEIVERTASRSTYVARDAREKVILRNVSARFEGNRDALEMIELRKIIEPEVAALAAERSDADLIENLQREYDEMERHSGSLDEFALHDYQFHTFLFSGTGNRIITDLIEIIHNAMQKSQSTIIHDSGTIHSRSLDFHKKILEAIKNGDGEEAGRVMRSHLLDIEREMRSVYK